MLFSFLAGATPRSALARASGLALVGASLASTVACGIAADQPRWWDALVPESPCYRVNVLDGLDEETTAEVDDLFACVDRHGHIAPLWPVYGDALHWDARSGAPAAIEFARIVNAMLRVDVDPFVVAGILGDAIRAEDRPIDEIVDLVLELTYGDRANRVRSGSVALTSAEDLENGVLVPLRTAIPAVATALLDDPTDTAGWVGGWIASDETKRWIRTFQAWVSSDDPVVQQPMDELVVNAGAALQATLDPSNDEWSAASGNSLRDLLDIWLLREDAPIIGEIAPEAGILMTDAGLRAAIEPALVDLHADGHLQAVPAQVVWMTTVDALGDPRALGEDSSLEAFIRLLARANGPVSCLGLLEFDNLSVTVLGVLADLDPDTVLAGLDVIAWITGNSVTDWALEGAVDLGICEGIDQPLLDDLDAVSVITQPEAYDLLVAFVAVLDVLEHDADQDRLPELADLVQKMYDAGGYEPLEEVLRDLGEQQLLVDIIDLVPVLSAPGAYGLTASGEPAVDLTDALGLLEWLFVVDEEVDLAGWQRVRPLLIPLLSDEGTWTALDHAARLMADDRTQTSQMLALLPPLLELDPDLTLLDELGPLLGDEALKDPVLRLVETKQLSEALLAPTPAEGQTEVPLAFVARLMIGGTLDDVLLLVDLLFGD